MLTQEDIAIISPRFWAKVDKNGPVPPVCPELGPCWIWTGGVCGNGYGNLHYKGTGHRAHRIAWLIETGRWPTPHGLHHCDTPLCVRFSHLFEGTNGDNIRDAVKKGKYNTPERLRWLDLIRSKAKLKSAQTRLRKLLEGMSC